ncbi:HNH endonuclease [Halorientalis brevis]
MVADSGDFRVGGKTMNGRRCPECDRVFDTRNGLAIHHSKKHGEVLPNRQCHNCEGYFHSEHQKKYCSDVCREEAVSFAGANNPNYNGGRETTTCQICDQEFEYYPSEKRGLYCPSCVETEQWRTPPTIEGQDHPRWSGGKQTVTCVVCGSEDERWPSEMSDVIVCSEECRKQWLSEAFTGEGHPNWKGGGSPSYGKGWNEIRSQALERDGYQCRVCGVTPDELDRNPDVHHIIPVRVYAESENHSTEDAHRLDNVISLCISCHRKADHGKIPRGRLRALIRTFPDDPD